jgi:hypothetical protein
MMIQSGRAVTADDLTRIMEPLIRRIIKEELERMAKRRPEVFYIKPDMPLYEDMLEIRKRSREKNTELYSHKEVWGE